MRLALEVGIIWLPLLGGFIWLIGKLPPVPPEELPDDWHVW